MAAGGDYAGAQPIAAESEARILELCTTHGYADIPSCIGQPLPALPQPPAPEQPPAEEPAAEQPAPEQPPAEQPAPEQPPAEQPSAEQPPAEQPPAEQPPADQTGIEQQLGAAVERYNAAAADFNANHDFSIEDELNAATASIADLCAQLGYAASEECLAAYGLSLTPLVPEVVPEQPAQEPTAEQPPAEPPAQPQEPMVGEDQPVTEEAVEPLPAEVAPTEAAPLLDSAKEEETGQTAAGAPPAEQPAEQPPAEPAAPPPETDAAAQADITPPPEIQSATAEQGQQAAPQEVAFAPPPNVTIINQTVVNNTTINNTTINNPPAQPQQGQQSQQGQQPAAGPSFSFVIQIGNQLVVNNPEQDRDRIWDRGEDDIFYERLSNGRVRETIVKPNGVTIVTIRNRYGDVLRRSKIIDGREYVLAYFDEEEPDYTEEWRDPGEDLPPLRINIRADQYILDADFADETEVADFFRHPPVEQVRRIYTIDEVKRSARIRDSVRRLEIGSLTFDTGKATISRSQVGALEKVADAMLNLLDRNPAETFLIEGHTDAVGSDVSNLILSDLRAATVARILTDFYGVPPENLVTQGYGERYLKVKTLEAERLNRRVTIRRITPLITIASN